MKDEDIKNQVHCLKKKKKAIIICIECILNKIFWHIFLSAKNYSEHVLAVNIFTISIKELMFCLEILKYMKWF